MSSSSRRAIACWVAAPWSGSSISTVTVLFTVMTVDPTTWSRPSSTSTQSHCWDRAS